MAHDKNIMNYDRMLFLFMDAPDTMFGMLE
jgi:hypothetical protein